MDTDLRLIDRIRLRLYSMPIVSFALILFVVVSPLVAITGTIVSEALGLETTRSAGRAVIFFGFISISIVAGRSVHERTERRKFASPRDRMLFAKSIGTARVPAGGFPPHWADSMMKLVQQRSLNVKVTVIAGLALLCGAAVFSLNGREPRATGPAVFVALAAFIGIVGFLETRRADRVERLLARAVAGRSEA